MCVYAFFGSYNELRMPHILVFFLSFGSYLLKVGTIIPLGAEKRKDRLLADMKVVDKERSRFSYVYIFV